MNFLHRPFSKALAASLCWAILATSSLPAMAQTCPDPGVLTFDEVFHFRSVRGPNTVNFGVGDRLVIAAFVRPNGLAGTTVVARQVCSDATGPICSGVGSGNTFSRNLFFIGDPVFSNEFARSVQFETGLTGQWELTASNPDCADEVAFTPDVTGSTPIPPVTNVRMSGRGTTPTFFWELPTGPDAIIDVVQISILDDFTDDRILDTGSLPPNTASFQLPDGFLKDPDDFGKPFVLRVKLQQNRSGTIFNRSEIFFNFQLLTENDPEEVAIPSVGVDTDLSDSLAASYEFDTRVVQGELIFVDPIVAVAYVYNTGAGDPNFASVVFPEVGDNKFVLQFDSMSENVVAGEEFVFPAGGVDEFTVLGIETAAALDPGNVLAFITGLTFVDDGQFTGTMTPIISRNGPEAAAIDIKPSTDFNKINSKKKGSIPVALLGSDDLDVTSLQGVSATFGPNGATNRHDLSQASTLAAHYDDVNADGDLDLVFHFRQPETGLTVGDTAACLSVDSTGGSFGGCDSVEIIK